MISTSSSSPVSASLLTLCLCHLSIHLSLVSHMVPLASKSNKPFPVPLVQIFCVLALFGSLPLVYWLPSALPPCPFLLNSVCDFFFKGNYKSLQWCLWLRHLPWRDSHCFFKRAFSMWGFVFSILTQQPSSSGKKAPSPTDSCSPWIRGFTFISFLPYMQLSTKTVDWVV